jgi:hypothetical protein
VETILTAAVREILACEHKSAHTGLIVWLMAAPALRCRDCGAVRIGPEWQVPTLVVNLVAAAAVYQEPKAGA